MIAAIERLRPGIAADCAAALSGHIPTLRLDGATLRAPRVADFDAYAAILCSDRGRFMGGPVARDAAWADFANYTALWLLHGHGLWSIDTGDEEPAGFVLLGLEWEDPEPELGVFLSENGEGRGLGTKACLAARDYGFDALGWDTVVSYVDPANLRCIALMQRLGATRDAMAEAKLNDPCLVFRHHARKGAA